MKLSLAKYEIYVQMFNIFKTCPPICNYGVEKAGNTIL